MGGGHLDWAFTMCWFGAFDEYNDGKSFCYSLVAQDYDEMLIETWQSKLSFSLYKGMQGTEESFNTYYSMEQKAK